MNNIPITNSNPPPPRSRPIPPPGPPNAGECVDVLVIAEEPPHSAERSEQEHLAELVQEWESKAVELDKLANKSFFDDDQESKKRQETKAGVYRAGATDLRRLARAVARAVANGPEAESDQETKKKENQWRPEHYPR